MTQSLAKTCRRGEALRQPSPAILAFRRRELERWIEAAIALLDAMDGDPDIEDDDLEDIDEREPPTARVMSGAGL